MRRASRKLKKIKTLRGGFHSHFDSEMVDFRSQLNGIDKTTNELVHALRSSVSAEERALGKELEAINNDFEFARSSGPKDLVRSLGRSERMLEKIDLKRVRGSVAQAIRRLKTGIVSVKKRLSTVLLVFSRVLRSVFKTIDAFQSFKNALSDVEQKEATGFLKTATDWAKSKQEKLGGGVSGKVFSKMIGSASTFMKVCANDDAYNYLDDMLDYSTRLVELEPVLVDNDKRRKMIQQQGIFRVAYRQQPGENIYSINAQTGGAMGSGTLGKEVTSNYLTQIMRRDRLNAELRRRARMRKRLFRDAENNDCRPVMDEIRRNIRSAQAEASKNGESAEIITGLQKLSASFEQSTTGGGGFFLSKTKRIQNEIERLAAKAKEKATSVTLNDVKNSVSKGRGIVARACRAMARAVGHVFNTLGSLSKYIDRLAKKGAVTIAGGKDTTGYFQANTWGVNTSDQKEALGSLERIANNWVEKKQVALENSGKSDRTKAAFAKVANAAKIAIATGTDKVASECLIDFLEASARVIDTEPVLSDLDARYISLDRNSVNSVGNINSSIIVSPTNYEESQYSVTKSINARIFDGVKIINALLDELKKEIHSASIRYPSDMKVEEGQSLFTKYAWKAYMVFAERLKKTRQNFRSYMSGNYTPHSLFQMFDEADRMAKDILSRIKTQGGRMSRQNLLKPLEIFKLDPSKFLIS